MHFTQIVQIKRNAQGDISVGGVQNPKDHMDLSSCLTLRGRLPHGEVLKKLAFRREERNKDHWFGYTHLLDASHIKQDNAHRYRLLLEIPIKDEPPYVDLLPCGVYGTHDGEFLIYILHTNAMVQVKETGYEFTGSYMMQMLEQENEHLHRMVLKGIKKYKLDQNDPDI